jgi:hypothetical protein
MDEMPACIRSRVPAQNEGDRPPQWPSISWPTVWRYEAGLTAVVPVFYDRHEAADRAMVHLLE